MESTATASPDPATNGISGLKRFVRPLTWAALVTALIAGLGFVGVPLLMHHYAPRILSDLLGREVSVDKTGFNPFALVVEFQGVKIMAAKDSEAAGTPALSVDRLRANLEISSLFYRGPVLREVEIAGPHIKLVRLAQDRYDWSDVIERLSAAPEAPKSEPPRFSVANIHVIHGLIEIDDRVTGEKHRLTELTLGVPVVSNLTVAAAVFVEPELSAHLDGRPVGAKGRLELTDDGFKGELNQLSLKDFDLPLWMAYSPLEPSFRLPSGVLNLDMSVAFEQRAGEAPEVRIQGRARLDRLVVQDRADHPVFAVDELEVELADVQPLLDRYYISRLRLQKPVLDLVRLADGSMNVARLASPGETSKAANAEAEKAAARNVPLDFLLSSARIRDGVVHFSDRFVPGGFSTRLEAINLDVRDLSTGGSVPAEIRLDYVTAASEKFGHQDRLRLSPAGLEYSSILTVEGFQPAFYKRYYAEALPGGDIRQGRLDVVIRSSVRMKEGLAEPEVDVTLEKLSLSDFVLGLNGSKGELLRLKNVVVADTDILSASRKVRLGDIDVRGLALDVTRLRDGRFNFMALAGKPSAGARRTSGVASAPWTVQVDKVAVGGGSSVRLDDRAIFEPAVTSLDNVELQLTDYSSAKNAKGFDFALQGQVNKSGQAAFKGTVTPTPLRIALDFELKSVGLTGVQPYLAEQAQLGIRGGRLSGKGRLVLRPRQEKTFGTLSGSATVSELATIDRRDDSDFVRWREVSVRRARVELEPFALSVDEIAIEGLRSRLILDEQGRLNLREIQRTTHEAAPPDMGPDEHTAASAPETPPPAVPSINVGRIVARNSNIAFTDRFVRPHYNAFLSDLSGELAGLSSDPTTLARLDLQGKVGRAAPLTIKGEFNPFREDRLLGIEADVKDFELTDLSGYSGRYVGYGISRGKLSATLHYKIEDRKLAAENHVFLDQLTFGDAIDSPEATHLPVRLAVALLKNSRGEIDIRMPVGGTIDDPQFSVFGLVVRALTNLVGKAVTSPFALLGREELAQLDFDAGSFQLGAEQEAKLRELVQTLEERPSLKLDLTGQANVERDMQGICRNKLRNMVAAGKRATLDEADKKTPLSAIELTDEEYAALLANVYDDASIKKPRNFIGMARSLPVEEMEKLLMASFTVDDEDVAALARRREAVVKRWLIDEGKVAPERIFQRALTESEARENGGNKGNGVRFSLR
ncbi:MAG: DUF748 domain-containing protein [Azoarcus sp.]|nr:DUF748 domain-containing protein [Azoarcus sp.]